MFLITKDEAQALSKKFAESGVTICSKRKKNGGKTYWCAENSAYKKFLEEYRNDKTKET